MCSLVVGYYTNSHEGRNEGIQLERHSNYSMNTVWFSNLGRRPVLPLRNKTCHFSRGSVSTGVLRSSTDVAPMHRISTSRCVAMAVWINIILSFLSVELQLL